MTDYGKIWADVRDLPWCVLITTGRTGTDFLQSLLDGHPEIFVFNGSLYFHTFWQSALSVRLAEQPNLSDFLDEFIGAHLIVLKSCYEPSERKDQLGDGRDQSIDIDTAEFKAHVMGLMAEQPVTSRNVQIAVYVAYDLCLKRDIGGKKLFFHHVHHVRKVDNYMRDFPDSKIICMTRDPRALYVSGVENWRRFEAKTDNPAYPQYILWRAVDESLPLDSYNDGRLTLLKLEDLAEEKTLQSLCDWLGVAYHPCMLDSTWASLRWWGDKISENQIPENERGFSKTISTNNWQQKLGSLDKTVLNYLLADHLEWYGYPCHRRDGIVMAALMAIAILLPTGYERRYLSPGYLLQALAGKNLRKLIAAFYHPLRRVIWFYKLFARRNFGSFKAFPIIGMDHGPADLSDSQ